jgi:hypothetical protein
MSTTTLQKTNISLLSLFCAVNFRSDEINIADWELSEHFLTLYLEDVKHPVGGLSEAVMYKLPISVFAQIIATEGFNSYEGVLYTHGGRPYDGRVEISAPLDWFNHDADLNTRAEVLEVVKSRILKASVRP